MLPKLMWMSSIHGIFHSVFCCSDSVSCILFCFCFSLFFISIYLLARCFVFCRLVLFIFFSLLCSKYIYSQLTFSNNVHKSESKGMQQTAGFRCDCTDCIDTQQNRISWWNSASQTRTTDQNERKLINTLNTDDG